MKKYPLAVTDLGRSTPFIPGRLLACQRRESTTTVNLLGISVGRAPSHHGPAGISMRPPMVPITSFLFFGFLSYLSFSSFSSVLLFSFNLFLFSFILFPFLPSSSFFLLLFSILPFLLLPVFAIELVSSKNCINRFCPRYSGRKRRSHQHLDATTPSPFRHVSARPFPHDDDATFARYRHQRAHACRSARSLARQKTTISGELRHGGGFAANARRRRRRQRLGIDEYRHLWRRFMKIATFYSCLQRHLLNENV